MASWSSLTNRIRRAPSRRNRPRKRLSVQPLESRNLLAAAGGGLSSGGIVGEYFDNPDLDGPPAFVRRDVRIDFDWQDRAPGGSISPGYQQVGADDFSVRWTGQLVPRFSERYTFHLTGDDGARLYIRPAGEPFAWNQLVDTWDEPTADAATGNYWLIAGQAYDVKVEYRELAGTATARLAWSSASTPQGVIESAFNLGVNAETYDFFAYADAAKTGWTEWGDPVDYFGRPRVETDLFGWPLADAAHIFWSGRDPARTGGTYLLRFTGQAEVSGLMGRGRFRVDDTEHGQTLPLGAGYDPETNTTTAFVDIAGTDLFGLNFVQTRRTPEDEVGSGITDVKLMRPTVVDGETPYQPGELFDADVKKAFGRFTTLRYLTANFNPEKEWTDRKLPGAMQAAYGDKAAVWEYEVMLANETGKDLYITLPVGVTEEYVLKLANLIRYGSDGFEPYTEFVADPAYPGLNPNLRIYIEWGNEFWNWAFSQAGWAADAGKDAVLSGTPDGLIVNFDGQRPGGDYRRWAALQTVKASTTFRGVWGDAAMGDRVRVLFEYQYDNQQFTAVEGLRFVDEYFNNGDGGQHVEDPHPVSYYIWGAGGAAYFGASNPRGLVNNIRVPGGTFEGVRIGGPGSAKAAPTGASWVFEGDAGLYREPAGAAANAAVDIPGVGKVPATPFGTQAMFVNGTGSARVTLNFPKAGVYAIDFQAAGEIGPDMGNLLDFYLDDRRITPNGRELKASPFPWWPGNGHRNAAAFSTYGTVPVQITTPGRYTFKVVGRGAADRTAVIDEVRVAGLDAIYASRIPAGGRSAGDVTNLDYQTQLGVQAHFAQAYGLNVVAYEAGWSLGGDREPVPLQSWAKYKDPRTAPVMVAAIDAFYRASGEMYVMGAYDQWHLDDAAHADSYPIVRGIDVRQKGLPPLPTARTVIRGSAAVALKSTAGLQALSIYVNAAPGDWVSWVVQIPTAGDYRLTANTGTGPAAISVDGIEMARQTDETPATGVVRLTAGVHTIRVQSVGGWFLISGVTIDRLDVTV